MGQRNTVNYYYSVCTLGTWLCFVVARQFAAKMPDDDLWSWLCRERTTQCETEEKKCFACTSSTLHSVDQLNRFLLAICCTKFSAVSVPHFPHLNSSRLLHAHAINSKVASFLFAVAFRLSLSWWNLTLNVDTKSIQNFQFARIKKCTASVRRDEPHWEMDKCSHSIYSLPCLTAALHMAPSTRAITCFEASRWNANEKNSSKLTHHTRNVYVMAETWSRHSRLH